MEPKPLRDEPLALGLRDDNNLTELAFYRHHLGSTNARSTQSVSADLKIRHAVLYEAPCLAKLNGLQVTRFLACSGSAGWLGMSDVTRILSELAQGDTSAAEELFPLVYGELRKLAAAKLAREAPGHTLQATALVHEAYVRLVDVPQTPHWNGQRHFFCAAAEAMRRILVENARRKHRLRRGGGLRRQPLEDVAIQCEVAQDELVALDEALGKLAAEDLDKANIVKLRFFAGLTHEEAARVLGISSASAKRAWRYARAWLHRELHGPAPTPRPDESDP